MRGVRSARGGWEFMLNRWIGILTFGFMLFANGALVLRDIAPAWLAGDPPRSDTFLLQPGSVVKRQTVILDGEDRPIGYSFTHTSRSAELLTVRSWTILDQLPLPKRLPMPQIRIVTEFTYNADSVLDNMTIRVSGFGVPATIRGEFVPPDSFPCEWQFDETRGTFLLSGAATRQLAESFRPFDTLPGLWVGRVWQMEIMNPLPHLMGGAAGGMIAPDEGPASQTVQVRVTRQEAIEHEGRMVNAFVVEADKLTAWVDPGGEILRQEVDMPLLGALKFVSQTYDDSIYHVTIDAGPGPARD